MDIYGLADNETLEHNHVRPNHSFYDYNSFETFDEFIEFEENAAAYNEEIARIIFNVYQIIVYIIGLIGNLFVIQAILRKSHLQTPIYIFLMNLALADIYTSTSILIHHFGVNAFRDWLQLEYTCSLLFYFPYIGEYSVISFLLIITSIAFMRKIDIKSPRAVNATVWIAATIVSLPYLQLFTQKQFGSEKFFYCGLSEIGSTFGFLATNHFEQAKSLFHPVFTLVYVLYHKTSKGTFFERSTRNDFLVKIVVAQITLKAPSTIGYAVHSYLDVSFANPMWIFAPIMFYLSTMSYRPILYVTCNEDFKREFKNLFGSSGNVTYESFQLHESDEV